jgi:hypothetical protein
MAGRNTRMLLMLGMAAGLSAALAAPLLAQSSTHRNHARSATQQANPNGQANSAANSFGAAQHAGQCWIPTGGGMNPNASFGYWGDCGTKGSVPSR